MMFIALSCYKISVAFFMLITTSALREKGTDGTRNLGYQLHVNVIAPIASIIIVFYFGGNPFIYNLDYDPKDVNTVALGIENTYAMLEQIDTLTDWLYEKFDSSIIASLLYIVKNGGLAGFEIFLGV